jgi:hypothetical protein
MRKGLEMLWNAARGICSFSCPSPSSSPSFLHGRSGWSRDAVVLSNVGLMKDELTGSLIDYSLSVICYF